MLNRAVATGIRRLATMSFKSENPKGDCPMFLAGNPKENPRGLVVLQEWWGMNEQIKKRAEGLAEQGFTTLVPDLYRGKVAYDAEEAGHLMNALDWPGAVKDIQGAARYLLEQGCTKVGVTGFCMGGALTFAAASCCFPEISAIAPFYGIPSAEHFDLTKIKIPTQAHFGEEDVLKGFSSPEDAAKLEVTFAGNPNFQLFMYPKCQHAFTNDTSEKYNKEGCELALSRLIKFMKENL